MRVFRTNCECPKCGEMLQTSDVEGYSFTCMDCDENFYGIEVKHVQGDYVEISESVDVTVFEKNEKN